MGSDWRRDSRRPGRLSVPGQRKKQTVFDLRDLYVVMVSEKQMLMMVVQEHRT